MKTVPFASYELNEFIWKRRCIRLAIALVVAVALLIGSIVCIVTYIHINAVDIPKQSADFVQRHTNDIRFAKTSVCPTKMAVNAFPKSGGKKRMPYEKNI